MCFSVLLKIFRNDPKGSIRIHGVLIKETDTVEHIPYGSISDAVYVIDRVRFIYKEDGTLDRVIRT